MINWRVRIRNKMFWLAIIPAVIVLIQTVASAVGFTVELGDIGDKLVDVVNAVFVVLAILGVVVDPTTAGVGDSSQALTYNYPKEDGND